MNDQQQALERIVRENDGKYYQLFRTLAQGVVYQDAEGNIISANPAAEKMLGLTLDQLCGRTSMDPRWHTVQEDGALFPGERHPAMVALRTGKEVRDVVMGVFNPQTEDYCWLNVHAVPEFRSGSKEPFQVFTSFEDISKLKRAQDTIAKERENFLKIFASAPVGLLLIDLETVVRQANKQASHLVLRDPGEMINQRTGAALGCLHSAESPKGCGFGSACPNCPLRQAIENVLKKGSTVRDAEIQLTLLVNDRPTTRWLNINIEPIQIDQMQYAIVLLDDITERKQADEELRVSREQLFATLNNTPSVAIQWYDELGRVLHWNPASEAIFGWSAGEAVGKTLDQLIYEAAEWEEFLRLIQEMKETGTPYGPYETPYRNRNGEHCWLLSTTFSIPMVDGKLGFVCMDVDITERKQLENMRIVQYELASTLSAVRSFQEGLALCLHGLLRATGLDAGAFYLVDQDSGGLNLITHHGLSQDFVLSVSHFDAASDRTRLVMDGAPFYTKIESMKLDRPEAFRQEGLRSLAVIPMLHEDHVIGCMNIASRTLDIIPSLLRKTLETIVAEAGHTIARLQAEEELRKSEERFRSLVETTSDWIWEVDEDAVYTYASPRVRDILGYEPEELLGQTPFDLMSTDEANRVQNIFGPLVNEQAPILNLENTNLHKDGRSVVLETSGVPIFDAAGIFRGYRGVDRDITEHKRVEKALHEKEMILEDILESTLSGYWDWNIIDNTEFLSPTFKMMFGYEDHELPNSPETWQKLIFPEDLPVVLDVYDRHIRSRGCEPYSNEVRYRHKDGSTVWVLCAGRVIEWAEDGSPIRMVGCHLDITDRKRVERELLDAQNKFQLLAKMSGEYIWQLDLSGKITYASRSIEKLHGYTAEEVLQLDYKKFFSESNLPLAIQTFERAVSGEEYQLLQIDSLKKDGTRLPISISVAPIIRGGEVVGVHGVSRDISAIRKAEEERFEALSLFSGFSEASQYGMGMADLEGRIVYVNPTLAHILGEGSPDACLGKHFPTTYYSDDMTRKLTKEVLPALMRDGQWHGELVLKSKDGRQVPTDENFFIIRDEKGNPRYLADILTDISERKQAEEQLRQARDRAQTYLDTVEAIIVVLEGDGRISMLNRKACRVLGYDESELLGQNWFATCLPQPEGMKVVYPVFNGMMAGHTEQLEYFENTVVTRNGENRLIQWHNAVLRDEGGRITATLSAGEDITERRRMEEALRESEERYRTLVESSPDAVGIFQNGRLVFVNSAAVELFGGKSAEDLLGLAIDDFVHPDDREDARSRVQKCLAGELDNYTAEVRYLCRDGSIVPVEIIVAPVLFDGMPGLLAIARDISERKRAEAALQGKTCELEHLTQHLEERVKTEITLRLQNEQMLIQQSRLAAMGEMLGAIAHQWRQPLNSLGLIIQNIKDAYLYDELDKNYLERAIDRSMTQVQRMSETIDDFRNFFRPEKENTVFDSMIVVGDVLSLLSAQLEENSIDYRLTCCMHGRTFTQVEEIVSCEEKNIRGYRNEFEHVVMNLISNASEAINDRKTQNDFFAGERGLIEVQFKCANDKLYIEISDNGTGIPESILDRIFEPYFTTKDSDKESTKGTGLGLYMSKTIVEQHMGGKLYVSNQDHGAIFTIEIPQMRKGNTNE